MFAIAALDAVSPAIQRTRTFLFRPFRLGTFLKLCLVACVTEGMGGNFQFSGLGGHGSHHKFNLRPPVTLTAGWIAVAVAAAVLLMVLSCVLYYLVTRLRFAYFHCLIHNMTEIRPGWRLYRAQATRFFWLNVAVGFCFLLAVVLIALPFVAGFWRLFHKPAGGHPDVGSILLLALPLIPIVLLLVLAAVAVNLILRDLMLPHYALENATAAEAWRAVWARIKPEKSAFFVYALLRILLPMVAMIAFFIALLLVGLLLIAAIVAAAIGIHVVLGDATSVTTTIRIFLAVLAGVTVFAFVLLAGISVGGTVGTAVREYALLFYGSRYQPLGEILWPPPDNGASVPGIA